MPTANPSQPRRTLIGHGLVFAGWLIALLLGSMPLAALIGVLGDFHHLAELLFFLPQYMLPFIGAVHRTAVGSVPAFPSPLGGILCLALWALAANLFAWATRTRRIQTTVLAAPLAIVALTILMNLALHAAGIPVELDGP